MGVGLGSRRVEREHKDKTSIDIKVSQPGYSREVKKKRNIQRVSRNQSSLRQTRIDDGRPSHKGSGAVWLY